MAKATVHLAGKTIFTKIYCSQAYFLLQISDELSIQLLEFNFGGRTFTVKKLAQDKIAHQQLLIFVQANTYNLLWQVTNVLYIFMIWEAEKQMEKH